MYDVADRADNPDLVQHGIYHNGIPSAGLSFDSTPSAARQNYVANSELQSMFADAMRPTGEAISNGVQNIWNAAKGLFDKPTTPSSGGSAGPAGPLSSYLNADLARAYGMDNATAYQEALANTAYQRAVKDLQAAGLNPVLAMGKVSPADTFSGSGAGSAGSGGSSGSRSGNSGKGFSLSNVRIGTTLAGVGTAIAGAAMKNKKVIAMGVGTTAKGLFDSQKW